jgi:predicted ATPase
VITEIEIANYKSIDKLKLELGRINVFIGENGAGKSNILEVIALAGAAAADKLDNEFLSSRGIRVTKPEYMRPAFPRASLTSPLSITLSHDFEKIACIRLENENSPYSKWIATFESLNDFKVDAKRLSHTLIKELNNKPDFNVNEFALKLLKISEGVKKEKAALEGKTPPTKQIRLNLQNLTQKADHLFAESILAFSPAKQLLRDFIIYSPENSSLRSFQREGQIEPLGINGEGLLKLLSVHAKSQDLTAMTEIKSSLKMLDWFEDFKVTTSLEDGSLEIRDRYLDEAIKDFDHKSTNEGFFFLLFYFALFSSELTPKFFAIDNIDASLNPKLCQKLMAELVRLANANNKQAIFTTHNPAILDGLDLDDNEQRLFVISRGRSGATKIKRVNKPKGDGEHPRRLSELFLRGVLGGLPKGF